MRLVFGGSDNGSLRMGRNRVPLSRSAKLEEEAYKYHPKQIPNTEQENRRPTANLSKPFGPTMTRGFL